MTTPYDHDALWLKAKLFVNRALDGEEFRSFDERALWATLALELLAKSALARTSPVLIAEPTEDGLNVLIATGLVEGEGKFRSVRASTVFSRCQRAFRPFSSAEAQVMTSARNEYLHGSLAGFTTIPEENWWPLFWRQAIILNSATDHDLADLVGPDREARIESYLERNRRNIEHRTEMLIEQARLRITQHRAGTLPARVAKRWSPGINSTAGLAYAETEQCPACQEYGQIEGETVHDRTLTRSEYSDEWDLSVEVSVYAEYFSCSNCGLILDRVELIEQAGMESIFLTDGSDADLAYLEGPEYGND
ncbi:hypothetical protein [Gordonia sputi]|uniref:hypothetical protein n=1 Tax=Gordonia sputi TaxID=36823 RepID=UPI00226E5CFC|nr:hypothetical protein [Gordonia sputi]